ncbi:hypothetical protein KI659_18115 [Litoribacter alkaliphilus]|uniref:Uncharacterized protein n=1 Tax=Litoribacter ruber TaxID=702568 RepID=A0AAP2CQ95_9BACT|nr:hypothetical protein [Litoribacter alkaliphilus]MBS9525942.1 hypothetical protein [Litoribacter alkaliphilus]
MTKSIYDDDFQLQKEDHSYHYQEELTPKLDALKQPFDQGVINEIVLWKVNRYAGVQKETLGLLNQIDSDAKEMDEDLTREVLKGLLKTKGIQLPMASTILRFKNKNVYQIIDQRVYRIIYSGETLKTPTYCSERSIQSQIELYFKYLTDLHKACEKLDIPFEASDRILYMADKRVNKDSSLAK